MSKKFKISNESFVTEKTPKKLIIKSFKVKPQLPNNYIQNTCSKLTDAVQAIYSNRKIPESLESLYKDCENLCHYRESERLYKALITVFKDHIKQIRDLLLQRKDDLLEEIKNAWNSYCKEMILIQSIFLYLDRTFLMQKHELKSIWETGLDLFRREILLDREIKEITIYGILDLLRMDRAGEYFSVKLLSSLIRMFQDLDIYFSVIEPLIIQETVGFYKNYSKKVLSPLVHDGKSSDWAAYLSDFFAKIKSESDRTDSSNGYLHIATRKKLIAVVDKEMGEVHLQDVVHKGFPDLMAENRHQDLLNMYLLCQRVNGLELLRKSFAEYIKMTGEAFIMDQNQDQNMVKLIISLKQQMDMIVCKAFEGSVACSNTVKESFESFINKRANKPAEMIAKHIDSLLRAVKITEEEVESSLEQCLALFRFIQGKDIFEAFYKKDLAKRLLLSKSASIDSEKSMLTKLKSGNY
jgi:cullin-4